MVLIRIIIMMMMMIIKEICSGWGNIRLAAALYTVVEIAGIKKARVRFYLLVLDPD